MGDNETTLVNHGILPGLYWLQQIRVLFPELDITMGSKDAATPCRGRELVRGNGMAGRKSTSRSKHRRSLYDTEARGSQRDVMWANIEKVKITYIFKQITSFLEA